jgi:hypothetical protein
LREGLLLRKPTLKLNASAEIFDPQMFFGCRERRESEAEYCAMA